MQKILVADEEEQMRHLLHAIFSRQGYDVKTVATGREALEDIYDHTYDIVILDHNLPVFNGVQITRWLDKHGVLTPIVLMGSVVEGTKRRTEKCTAVKAVLNKPFKVQELARTVKAIIN